MTIQLANITLPHSVHVVFPDCGLESVLIQPLLVVMTDARLESRYAMLL